MTEMTLGQRLHEEIKAPLLRRIAELEALLDAAVTGAAKLQAERDAVLRWATRHAGWIGTRNGLDGLGEWWARGDGGMAYGATAEEAVRRAAGIGGGDPAGKGGER